MGKLLVIAIIGLFVSSCTKTGSTIYQAYLKNETAYPVKIDFFYSGSSVAVKQIALSPGQQFEIAYGSFRGLVGKGGFISEYFTGSVDSARVVFDHTFPVSHYVNTPIRLYEKRYLYTSERNLFNANNYNYELQSIRKDQNRQTYTYIFKEADYQFAKN